MTFLNIQIFKKKQKIIIIIIMLLITPSDVGAIKKIALLETARALRKVLELGTKDYLLAFGPFVTTCLADVITAIRAA